MARRHYSDEERAAALAILDARGGRLAEAAKAARVPRQTLQRWIESIDRAAPPQLRLDKRAELAALFEAEAKAALVAASDCRDDARYRELMTGAGIATDKWQLLTGGATARIEHDVVVIDAGDDGRG